MDVYITHHLTAVRVCVFVCLFACGVCLFVCFVGGAAPHGYKASRVQRMLFGISESLYAILLKNEGEIFLFFSPT